MAARTVKLIVMFSNLFKTRSRRRIIKLPSFNSTIVTLVPVDNVLDGKIVRNSEFKPVDNKDYMSKFKSSDFSISSLLAAGAYDILNRPAVMSTSRINAADQFDNFEIKTPQKDV